MKKAEPTKEELIDLFYKVDDEGFGYYMFCYGPDWDLIERMGFDISVLKASVKELKKLEVAIQELEEIVDE